MSEPQLAPWAKLEQSRRMWIAWRAEFFSRVRLTFMLLLAVAIYVFISDHQLQIQLASAKGLHRVFNHVKLSDKLKQKALGYQTNVDTASDFQQSQQAASTDIH
ncbi:MAG TPA: hypothetical protein VGI03_08915 [Verrucomicrobiae bacterium]|jgi:hypothetical protein